CIPVIMLTSSRDRAEMEYCYQLHANAYVVKSAEVDQFFDLVKKIEDFWFSVAILFSGEEVRWGGESVESPTNGTTVSSPLPKRCVKIVGPWARWPDPPPGRKNPRPRRLLQPGSHWEGTPSQRLTSLVYSSEG